MTTPKVNWSERDQKYWVYTDEEPLWFESVLDAQAAARQIEIDNAVKAERERIIALIEGRLSTHNSFIEHCMDEGVEPSISVLSAACELKAILREIDK
jgi:hypothetical protein